MRGNILTVALVTLFCKMQLEWKICVSVYNSALDLHSSPWFLTVLCFPWSGKRIFINRPWPSAAYKILMKPESWVLLDWGPWRISSLVHDYGSLFPHKHCSNKARSTGSVESSNREFFIFFWERELLQQRFIYFSPALQPISSEVNKLPSVFPSALRAPYVLIRECALYGQITPPALEALNQYNAIFIKRVNI